ncbi:flagellar hook-associated protein 3 FlgL [Actinokineospora baliensis]|uniref:flagellin N-terminal helical domain-containing protein n=1 Tax=Actinokineospora baliensis TaxID=547056 RepID=UPI0019598D3F|nr:flagellin [Actinokineospora baliensis]MBM7773353.1 flagellar hook-associated protein 3 FlgL [Actinokineospora baliensis]
MVAFRVTEQSTSAKVLAGLRTSANNVDRLREQMTTGKQVAKPSDSPTGTVSAMQLRNDIAARERYDRSATDGVARLSTAEAALSTGGDLLNRARDLVLQGMSQPAVGDPAARAGIAVEIRGLRDNMISVANTSYLGRPVFGGTTDKDRAFLDTGAYQGDTGSVQRRVGDSSQVRVDVSADVFGTAAGNVFDVLDSIATGLETNPATLSSDLNRLDSAKSRFTNELTAVGSRYSQLTAAQDTASTQVLALTSRLSEIEDIDMAKAVIDLQTQSAGYEAALAATARVVQPSLLDFLR